MTDMGIDQKAGAFPFYLSVEYDAPDWLVCDRLEVGLMTSTSSHTHALLNGSAHGRDESVHVVAYLGSAVLGLRVRGLAVLETEALNTRP